MGHEDVDAFRLPSEFFGVDAPDVGAVDIPVYTFQRLEVRQASGEPDRSKIARMPDLVTGFEMPEDVFVKEMVGVGNQSNLQHGVKIIFINFGERSAMPHYHSLGTIPHKRHTQFRQGDGSLYSEQLFSTEGFSNDYSLLYHIHPPTEIIATDAPYDAQPRIAEEKMLKHRSFDGFLVKPEADFLQSRKAVLVNNDCHIVLAAPAAGMENYFYKNADADELIFVHHGGGTLKTMYGELSFGYGDYLLVPRG